VNAPFLFVLASLLALGGTACTLKPSEEVGLSVTLPSIEELKAAEVRALRSLTPARAGKQVGMRDRQPLVAPSALSQINCWAINITGDGFGGEYGPTRSSEGRLGPSCRTAESATGRRRS
jgi:hypothetical protein